MHNLFLDANSYLGFYSLSPADVLELAKLEDLIGFGKLTLYLPDQVQDEVRRNRARVVAHLIKPVRDGRVQVPSPPFLATNQQADALKKALTEAQKAHSKLLEELDDSARDGTFPADARIGTLFKKAQKISEPNAFALASQRKALGRPPGKGGSLGDAVNWETLLRHVPRGQDLCFVTADGDFASPLEGSRLDEYLLDEWYKSKKSTIHFYRDIKSFLESTFPQIHLASDVRKYFLIEALVESGSFAGTHSAVAELAKFDSFSLNEASRILAVSLENSQVRWLARDDDVKELIGKVLGPHRSALPRPLVAKWDYLISDAAPSYASPPTDEEVKAALS